jgi:hypothetical protein
MKLTSSNALSHSVTVQLSGWGLNESEVVARFPEGAKDETDSGAPTLFFNWY